MEATAIAGTLLLAVVVSSTLARLLRLPLPLVQMALGAAIYGLGLAAGVLDPALFFLLFLPPLLFIDGWRIPQDALRRDAGTILTLALGLVLATVLGMGWFIHWLIPAMPLAVAFALAGVIAPTDPIAVRAVAARHPIPARLMHLLQGEALLNDASGLVCMRFAVAAALTGSFSLTGALASFAWVAAGGLLIGAGVTWGVARIAARTTEQGTQGGGSQILATLLLPFGVYLLAERLHCSGILAAVAAGLTMNLTDAWPWRAATRLQRTAVWDTVQLATNGAIFVLLGQQLPALLSATPTTVLITGHSDPWWLAGAAGLIVLGLGALRFAWVGLSFWLGAAAARRRGDDTPLRGWRVVMVASLGGVRGAVTLAGVLTLPLLLPDGSPFPARDLAILLAAGVIVLSLAVTTLLLPPVLRGLHWPAAAVRSPVEHATRRAAAEAALLALQHAHRRRRSGPTPDPRYAEAEARLLAMYEHRIARNTEAGPVLRLQEQAIERELGLLGLRAERAEARRYGRLHGLDELALRRIVRELDFQEARYGV